MALERFCAFLFTLLYFIIFLSMLRAKNLKKVLEKALTREICACSVFNEEGVMLAHAVNPTSFANSQQSESAIGSNLTQMREGHSQETAKPKQPEDGFTTSNGNHRESLTSSFDDPFATDEDDNGEVDPIISTRERLEDGIAIAAKLWQAYENMPNLVESKDDYMDDTVEGDGGEPEQQQQPEESPNNLSMVIIECDNGKAVVTRLGTYRLFLLSTAEMPLGMLKLKADSLRRFLEECLQCSSTAT